MQVNWISPTYGASRCQRILCTYVCQVVEGGGSVVISVYPFNNKYDRLDLTEILGWIIYCYILTAILQLIICGRKYSDSCIKLNGEKKVSGNLIT